MIEVDTTCSLESFRKFLLSSTCRSFTPQVYLDDTEIFPERYERGIIYVEAADKVTIKKIEGITFVNARDVLGIIYNSNSGSTSIKWRQTSKFSGRASGHISKNSLKYLAESGVLTLAQIEKCVEQLAQNNAKKVD